MRRVLRLALIAGAFVAGCHAQNELAIDTCLDRGGKWLASSGVLPGGVCAGVRPG